MMKNSTRISISLLSLATTPFISGCGSSTEQVKETSSSATYIPSPPPQVVVQPAPVVVSPPTTVTTTEEKSASNSTDLSKQRNPGKLERVSQRVFDSDSDDGGLPRLRHRVRPPRRTNRRLTKKATNCLTASTERRHRFSMPVRPIA
jgi:hypothetical protein